MVDLVKIRKKAKEQARESSEASAAPVPPSEATPPAPEAAVPPPGDAPSPEPVAALSPEPPKAAAAKTKKGRQEVPPAKTRPAADAAPAGAQKSASSDDAVGEGRGRTKLDVFKDQAGTQRFGDEAGVAASAEDETLRELLTFSLAGENYAIDIESIVEITPPRDVTRIPNAEASVIGIISLRGTIVTVLDLRQILGHPPLKQRGDDDARIIVLERKGQTSGILVDRVFRVAKVARHELANHPVVSTAEHNAAIEGVFQHNEVLTIVLNLERLLTS